MASGSPRQATVFVSGSGSIAARISAEVIHNHPEGIKGAEDTASAIFLARAGHSKAEIKAYISKEFGYDLSRTCDEIRPDYHHVQTCQKTVPEAITAFLEGESFEDVIQTAVSLGGDCDTVAAIAGSIAERSYGVPEELKNLCRNRLPIEFQQVLDNYDILTILEKNQLWKLVLKKVTVYPSQDDELSIQLYPNLPK